MDRRNSYLLSLAVATMLGCSQSPTDPERTAATSVVAMNEAGIKTPDLQELLDSLVADGAVLDEGRIFATAGQIVGNDPIAAPAGKASDGNSSLGSDGIVEVSIRSTASGKPEVVGLGINFSKADNKFLKRLEAIRTLRSLKIENATITIDGLRSLSSKLALKQLCIADSNSTISDSEVEELDDELTACRVFRALNHYNPHQ